MKASNYGSHYNDEDHDKYCKMQITSKNFSVFWAIYWTAAKTYIYKTHPGIYEPNDFHNAFNASNGSVQFEAVDKTVKTILTTHHSDNNSKSFKSLRFSIEKLNFFLNKFLKMIYFWNII